MRLLWFLAALAAYAASVFLHLPATDAVEWLLPRMGLATYDRLWTIAAVVLGLGAWGFVWWRERTANTSALATLWSLLPVMALAQGLLVVAPIEFVHYPQYALVSFLLARAGIPLEWSWLTSVALGAVDEGHQRLFLPRGTPDYFDWNDVVLNATGAAIGLVVLAAWRRRSHSLSFTRTAVLTVIAIAALIAVTAAPTSFSPYLTETPRHTWFRVLSPLEAVALLGVVWGCVRRLAASGRS